MKRCTGKDLFNCPKGHPNICDCARTECCLPDAKTNADHIRSMTDEELAALLSEVEYRRSIGGGGAIWFDDEGAMVWLKQPYKEDTWAN